MDDSKKANSSPEVSLLKICKSPPSSPKYYDDDYYDSYESSVETDPKWGRELDSEGEPIYTPEPDWPENPDREYIVADALFCNSDCEEEEWLDKLGPFSSMFLFLWVRF